MVPACSGVNLRGSATTSSAVRTRLATTAKLTVAATVSGPSWRTECAGPKSGSTWHRISHVNGATVRSHFGVTYLYAAAGLLKAAPLPRRAPVPDARRFHARARDTRAAYRAAAVDKSAPS